MAKPYAQDKKDRRDESRGMEKYEARKGLMDSQFYGMISEDRSAPSNLPREVMMKQYPKTSYMGAFELDDTIRGLDETRDEDIRKMDGDHPDSKW